MPMKNELRVRRAMLRMTQAELAERLGVSRQTVNAIETEKYDPSLLLAFKIAEAFQCRIEDVFFAPNGTGRGIASQPGFSK
jgi:putative transcriptional regulator